MTLVFGYSSVVLWGLLRARPRHLADEGAREEARKRKRAGPGQWHLDEVFLAVLVHFAFYSALVLFAAPDAVRATGLHQVYCCPSPSPGPTSSPTLSMCVPLLAAVA